MPRFAYRALNSNGEIQVAELEAKDIESVTLRLQSRQLTPLRIHRLYFPQLVSTKTQPSDTILRFWCAQLSALLGSGIALDDALDDLQRDTHSAHPALGDLGNLLREGKSLSDALFEQAGQSINTHWIQLIAAGEKAGHLSLTLHQLGEHLAWKINEQAQTRQSLIQPIVSAISVLGAALFLVIYLTPQLRPLFSMATLPWSTRSVFWLSDILQNQGQHFFSFFITLLFLGYLLSRTFPQCRDWYDQIHLKLPLIGTLALERQLAQYVQTWGLLYQNGIPMLDAMQASRHTVANKALGKTLANTEAMVASGMKLRFAFESNTRISWPTPTLRMLRHGEKTGNLATALSDLSKQLQHRQQQRTRQLNSLLQPAVTIGSGILLAWVALALLGPLYNQFSQSLP